MRQAIEMRATERQTLGLAASAGADALGAIAAIAVLT